MQTHVHRHLFGQMLRRNWGLPVPRGWHSDCRRKIENRRRRIGAVSEKSARVDDLTSVGARGEGICGMVRSTREQNLSAKISCQERATSLFFPLFLAGEPKIGGSELGELRALKTE
jgi:hypothetical protein